MLRTEEPLHRRCKRAQGSVVVPIFSCLVLEHSSEGRRRLWPTRRNKVAELRREVELSRRQLCAKQAGMEKCQSFASAPLHTQAGGPDCSAVDGAGCDFCRVKQPQFVRAVGVLCEERMSVPALCSAATREP